MIFFLLASQNPLVPTFGDVAVRVVAAAFVVALILATVLWFRGAAKKRSSDSVD